MSEPLHDRVIAAIGQLYELENEIGRGGMSAVFRARDLRLNRAVAIKVLPPELAYDPAVRARFTREAQTFAHLSHPNIVPIYDVGEREGIAYFVMALASGGSLAALLAREPRQPLDEVRRLLIEIADALDFAHRHGVVHRDIKPDNILLDRDTGRAMVTDFGIARAMEAGTRLTITGNAVGTPTYMSPEQATGERELDGRSDIYSLGVVAYQMVTGRVPFSASSAIALLFKHLHEAPRPIAELRPDAPRSLRKAIERALEKDPEERWPTAAALRDALRHEQTVGAPWRGAGEITVSSPPNGVDRSGTRRDGASNVSRSTSRLAPVPQPEGTMPEARPRENGGIELVPPHLAALTTEQRADLRLWHGRVNLLDRVKAARGYALLTLGTAVGAFGMAVGGLAEGAPPLVFGLIVPYFMSRKLRRRGTSLRESGLRLRRVFLSPRARWVIPPPPARPGERTLEKLAPREVLDGPHGASIRRAAEHRAAILDLYRSLPEPDRALIPELAATVDALVERVAQIAQALHRLESSIDLSELRVLDAQLEEAQREPPSPENDRRIGFLKRQRGVLQDLLERQSVLARQLDNGGLALGNLRLDLVRLRSSGMQSALSDVTSATQDARALSREIDSVLEAAAEVRRL